MTDNEKAATFIGWREGQKCSGSSICYHGTLSGSHPLRAPDMTDPRNYMKALERLPSEIWWEIGRGVTGGLFCAIDNREDLHLRHKNVVGLLAAYYDSEHKELTDGSSPAN